MAETDLISIDTKQVRTLGLAFKLLEKKAPEDIKKALKRFLIYHREQTIRAFDQGGREGEKWRALTKPYLARRKRLGQGTKILKIKGEIQKSIRAVVQKVDGQQAAITFTRQKIAPYHDKAKLVTRRRKILLYTKKDIDTASLRLLEGETGAIKDELKKKLPPKG